MIRLFSNSGLLTLAVAVAMCGCTSSKPPGRALKDGGTGQETGPLADVPPRSDGADGIGDSGLDLGVPDAPAGDGASADRACLSCPPGLGAYDSSDGIIAMMTWMVAGNIRRQGRRSPGHLMDYMFLILRRRFAKFPNISRRAPISLRPINLLATTHLKPLCS